MPKIDWRELGKQIANLRMKLSFLDSPTVPQQHVYYRMQNTSNMLQEMLQSIIVKSIKGEMKEEEAIFKIKALFRFHSFDYTILPYQSVQACILVAGAIAEDNEAICQLLMPQIKEVVGGSLDSIQENTEEVIDGKRRFDPNKYCLEGNRLLDIVNLFEYAKSDGSYFFGAEMGKDAYTIFNITDKELLALSDSKDNDTKNYMAYLKAYYDFQQNPRGLAKELKKLADALYKSSKRVNGTEMQADLAVLDTAIKTFYLYWNKLPELIRNGINQHTINYYDYNRNLESLLIAIFSGHPECLLTEKQKEILETEKILRCTAQLSDGIRHFSNIFLDEKDINISREKLENFHKVLVSVVENGKAMPLQNLNKSRYQKEHKKTKDFYNIFLNNSMGLEQPFHAESFNRFTPQEIQAFFEFFGDECQFIITSWNDFWELSEKLPQKPMPIDLVRSDFTKVELDYDKLIYVENSLTTEQCQRILEPFVRHRILVLETTKHALHFFQHPELHQLASNVTIKSNALCGFLRESSQNRSVDSSRSLINSIISWMENNEISLEVSTYEELEEILKYPLEGDTVFTVLRMIKNLPKIITTYDKFMGVYTRSNDQYDRIFLILTLRDTLKQVFSENSAGWVNVFNTLGGKNHGRIIQYIKGIKANPFESYSELNDVLELIKPSKRLSFIEAFKNAMPIDGVSDIEFKTTIKLLQPSEYFDFISILDVNAHRFVTDFKRLVFVLKQISVDERCALMLLLNKSLPGFLDEDDNLEDLCPLIPNFPEEKFVKELFNSVEKDDLTEDEVKNFIDAIKEMPFDECPSFVFSLLEKADERYLMILAKVFSYKTEELPFLFRVLPPNLHANIISSLDGENMLFASYDIFFNVVLSVHTPDRVLFASAVQRGALQSNEVPEGFFKALLFLFPREDYVLLVEASKERLLEMIGTKENFLTLVNMTPSDSRKDLIKAFGASLQDFLNDDVIRELVRLLPDNPQGEIPMSQYPKEYEEIVFYCMKNKLSDYIKDSKYFIIYRRYFSDQMNERIIKHLPHEFFDKITKKEDFKEIMNALDPSCYHKKKIRMMVARFMAKDIEDFAENELRLFYGEKQEVLVALKDKFTHYTEKKNLNSKVSFPPSRVIDQWKKETINGKTHSEIISHPRFFKKAPGAKTTTENFICKLENQYDRFCL